MDLENVMLNKENLPNLNVKFLVPLPQRYSGLREPGKYMTARSTRSTVRETNISWWYMMYLVKIKMNIHVEQQTMEGLEHPGQI